MKGLLSAASTLQNPLEKPKTRLFSQNNPKIIKNKKQTVWFHEEVGGTEKRRVCSRLITIFSLLVCMFA